MKYVCTIIHRYIEWGICSRCKNFVTATEVRDGERSSPGEIRWIEDLLLADVTSGTFDKKSAIITLALQGEMPVGLRAVLLSTSADDTDNRIGEMACCGTLQIGAKSTEKEYSELTGAANLRECYAWVRIMAIGRCFLRIYASQSHRLTRFESVMWLIANRPESPVHQFPQSHLDSIFVEREYHQAKQLWLKNVKDLHNSPRVLRNAAAFTALRDAHLSAELIDRARKIEGRSKME